MATSLTDISALVIDDSIFMRRLMRTILNQLGVTDVEEASDGSTAIKAMAGKPFDVVLTDNEMAPVDGQELTRLVRMGRTEAERTVPIVMVSAATDLETICAARDCGINEFLAKPVSLNLVALRLRAVLERPRPFVEAGGFFGPDRRRREMPPARERRRRTYRYDGQRRRAESRVPVANAAQSGASERRSGPL